MFKVTRTMVTWLVAAFMVLTAPNFNASASFRIVSLAQSLSKNIISLRLEDQLVGCTEYCAEARAMGSEVVASAIKVNVEKVVMLKPDLVIVTGLTNQETIGKMRKMGLRVEVFLTPKTFGEICSQYMHLAKLTGRDSMARQHIAGIELKVLQIRGTTREEDAPRVFFQLGARPLFAVLPGTFMNDFITFCGGKNIIQDTRSGLVSREAVVAANPDFIFIASMGITGEEERQGWEGFTLLKAVKQRQVYILDAQLACSPTPHSFLQCLEIMYSLMHQAP